MLTLDMGTGIYAVVMHRKLPGRPKESLIAKGFRLGKDSVAWARKKERERQGWVMSGDNLRSRMAAAARDLKGD